MRFGIALIAVSILSLVATLGFAAPPWVNFVGLVSGIAGLYLLSRKRG